MSSDPRTLAEICNGEGGDFSRELLGNVYCSLSTSRKVECPFVGDSQDKNGLYACRSLKYSNEVLGSA